MLSYILRRAGSTAVVMLLVSLMVFMLLYLAPGDPAAMLAGERILAFARDAQEVGPPVDRHAVVAVRQAAADRLRRDHAAAPLRDRGDNGFD